MSALSRGVLIAGSHDIPVTCFSRGEKSALRSAVAIFSQGALSKREASSEKCVLFITLGYQVRS